VGIWRRRGFRDLFEDVRKWWPTVACRYCKPIWEYVKRGSRRGAIPLIAQRRWKKRGAALSRPNGKLSRAKVARERTTQPNGRRGVGWSALFGDTRKITHSTRSHSTHGTAAGEKGPALRCAAAGAHYLAGFEHTTQTFRVAFTRSHTKCRCWILLVCGAGLEPIQ